MTQAPSWKDAFPPEESVVATKLLVDAWNELVSYPGTAFNHSLPEPKLTDILCEHLKDISESRGRLTGRWGQEAPFGKIDPTKGKRITSYRTDIEYFSNRSSQVITLVFEFKKIDDKKQTLTKYSGPNGMRRFIDGDYGIKQPMVLMAGIAVAPKDDCISALKELLTSTACADLQWRKGAVVVEPSLGFPDYAEFDTEHIRPSEKLHAQGYVRICHMFLGFPARSA